MTDLDDLKNRVNKFGALELPGQPQGMHMGTSYLVGDLWRMVVGQHAHGLELAKALSTCITAMNPPDRAGISMHEWNKRLKAATKQAAAVFGGEET